MSSTDNDDDDVNIYVLGYLWGDVIDHFVPIAEWAGPCYGGRFLHIFHDVNNALSLYEYTMSV